MKTRKKTRIYVKGLTGTQEGPKLLDAGKKNKAPKLNWCAFQGPKAQNY